MKKLFRLSILIFIAASTMSFASDLGDVDIHGFIAQGYLQSTDNNFYAETKDGTFQFNEVGINFTTRLNPQLRVGMQLFARDIGPYGNDEVTVDWVYGDYRYKRWLGLRAGMIKIPLSLYSEIRDMDYLRTFIFLPQGVYHEIRRDTFAARKGVELYGSLPRNPAGLFSYRLQAGVIDLDPEDGNSKFLEALVYPVWTVEAIEPDTSYLARIDWSTPLEGFRLYATYTEYDYTVTSFFEDWGENEIDFSMTGPFEDYSIFYGAQYTFGELVLSYEFMKEESVQTLDYGSYGSEEYPRHRRGFYVSGTYRFNDWFECGLYYSEYDGDYKDEERKRKAASGDPIEDRSKYFSEEYCLSTRFDINPNWLVKLEAHMFDGLSVLIDQDQLSLKESEKEDNEWWLFAAKLSYAF